MPGHRNTRSWSTSFKNLLISLDTTELAVTDDLHQPTGPALAAQQAAADCFGAGQTFFLTHGTTGGILALLAGLVGRGQTLILPRTCHVSVHHAVALLDLEPIWIELDHDPKDFCFLPPVSPSAVEAALVKAPQSAAVFLTSPDYYGCCSDLAAIAKVVHRHGKLLLVDEAHGTHFAARPDLLPPSALLSGADASVQSAHKTLPALTQGAYLHLSAACLENRPMAREQIRSALRIFMTSSPSFVIAASLDYARFWLETEGKTQVAALLERIEAFRQKIDPVFEISATRQPADTCCRRDPLRLVIRDRSGLLPAPFLARQLMQSDIDIEMADLTRLVLIPSLDTPDEDFQQLASRLNQLAAESLPKPGQKISYAALERTWLQLLVEPAERMLSSGDVLLGQHATQLILLETAADRICAAPLSPYPPGIPLVLPGERIDPSRLDLLLRLQENKITLSGMEHGLIRVLV